MAVCLPQGFTIGHWCLVTGNSYQHFSEETEYRKLELDQFFRDEDSSDFFTGQ